LIAHLLLLRVTAHLLLRIAHLRLLRVVNRLLLIAHLLLRIAHRLLHLNLNLGLLHHLNCKH
jgi:hypothetical protein